VQNRGYWIDTTQTYFTERPTLKRVFVLVDGSIPPQKIDMEFIATLEEEKIPYTIVVTKMDKAKQKDFNANLRALKDRLEEFVEIMPKLFPISNVSKKGREELLNYIQDLMG